MNYEEPANAATCPRCKWLLPAMIGLAINGQADIRNITGYYLVCPVCKTTMFAARTDRTLTPQGGIA